MNFQTTFLYFLDCMSLRFQMPLLLNGKILGNSIRNQIFSRFICKATFDKRKWNDRDREISFRREERSERMRQSSPALLHTHHFTSLLETEAMSNKETFPTIVLSKSIGKIKQIQKTNQNSRSGCRLRVLFLLFVKIRFIAVGPCFPISRKEKKKKKSRLLFTQKNDR